jgi:hypothetical protein
MKPATIAVYLGESSKTGVCPITGRATSSVYQCFPTGRIVLASGSEHALESHNSRVSSPEPVVQAPQPVAETSIAVWDTPKKQTKNNMQNTITHLVAITCRVLPATDTRPARVKAELPRFHKSVVLPWNYSINASEASDQLGHWLQTNGVHHCAFLDLHDHCILAVDWEQVPKLLEVFKAKKVNRYKKQ